MLTTGHFISASIIVGGKHILPCVLQYIIAPLIISIKQSLHVIVSLYRHQNNMDNFCWIIYIYNYIELYKNCVKCIAIFLNWFYNLSWTTNVWSIILSIYFYRNFRIVRFFFYIYKYVKWKCTIYIECRYNK